MDRGELLLVVAAFVVGLVVPSVAHASLLGELVLYGVADGEMQCLYAFTTLFGSSLIGVVAAGSVRRIMPCVRVAFCDVELFCLAIVDGEVEDGMDLAALRRDIIVFVRAALCIGFAIPGVLVTFGDGFGWDVLGLIEGQV